jgi:acyl-CoA thioesterase-1
MKKYFLLSVLLVFCCALRAQTADISTYLSTVRTLLNAQFPNNRTINIVFHGNGVPCGYAQMPTVNTLDAYPHLLFHKLKENYPYAVLNVITTAVGGETSILGAARFDADVLPLHPDVVCIDYALNDCSAPLDSTKKAWRLMIETALSHQIKVILLTPTPDERISLKEYNTPLDSVSSMIRSLAGEYHVGCVDCYATFKTFIRRGAVLSDFMSQVNHPNRNGHEVVETLLYAWFNGKSVSPTAVANVSCDGKPIRVDAYDLQGRKIAAPADNETDCIAQLPQGKVYILRSTRADKSCSVKKIIK